jgi:RimJ/RimL family protein N-acetyltransferase
MIETKRLLLRPWKPEDAETYFHINQDPNVIAFLPGTMTIAEVHTFITRCNHSIETHQFGLYAVEVKATQEMIGFIGLAIPSFEAHFTPAVEIGWRLGSAHWNQGYASEGATACLDYGFNIIGLTEIVSFTIPENTRSIRVMKKLGMTRNPDDDFRHPRFEANHRLSKHVLYRIQKHRRQEQII